MRTIEKVTLTKKNYIRKFQWQRLLSKRIKPLLLKINIENISTCAQPMTQIQNTVLSICLGSSISFYHVQD